MALRHHLEKAGSAFLAGYHLALESGTNCELESQLRGMDLEWRGFAFEGAAMGLALLERLLPWHSDRIRAFLLGPGAAHSYMIHVGIGWVWALIPFGFRRWQRKLDPLLGWLAFDGWGFYEGFFSWPNYIYGQPPPKKLKGYERRVFDQGFGRSLWFVNGGNVKLIGESISGFPVKRQADLWSGIGLAATYAGTADVVSLRRLRELSGPFCPYLAQGAAFAAKARQRAGNATDHTELAAEVFCNASADQAARTTDAALENLPADSREPGYEIWRQRIQHRLARSPQLQEN